MARRNMTITAAADAAQWPRVKAAREDNCVGQLGGSYPSRDPMHGRCAGFVDT